MVIKNGFAFQTPDPALPARIRGREVEFVRERAIRNESAHLYFMVAVNVKIHGLQAMLKIMASLANI